MQSCAEYWQHQQLNEDEGIESLEDIEENKERARGRRKVRKVESFKRLMNNKVEEIRSKSSDVLSRNEKKEVPERGSMMNLIMTHTLDYKVTCLTQHDRWHNLLANKNLYSSGTDLDGASTVSTVATAIQVTGKYPGDYQQGRQRMKKQSQTNLLYGCQMMNSLPRNCKLSRSEESGYDSDITRGVDTILQKLKSQIPLGSLDILLILKSMSKN